MARDTDIQSVIVQIFGDDYNIVPSDGGAVEVEWVAAYVDRKMRDIAAGQPNLSKAKVAVLAAMDITADLMRAANERNALTEKAHQSLDRLNQLVEERAEMSVVEPSSPPSRPRPVPSLDDLLRATRQRDPSSVQ